MATAEQLMAAIAKMDAEQKESIARIEKDLKDNGVSKEIMKVATDQIDVANTYSVQTLQRAQQDHDNTKNQYEYRIRTLETKAQGSNRNDLVNRKDLLHERWSGKGVWEIWIQEMKEYVGCWDRGVAEAMWLAENHKEIITRDGLVTAGVSEDQDRQLRSFISGRVIKGSTSGDFIEQGIAQNLTGLEVWRKLSAHFAPLIENRKVDAAMGIMSPGRANSLQA